MRKSDSKAGKTRLKPVSALGLEAPFRGGATRATGVRITPASLCDIITDISVIMITNI